MEEPNVNAPPPCAHCGGERHSRSNPYCKPCRAAYGRARRYLGRDKTLAAQGEKTKNRDKHPGRPRGEVSTLVQAFMDKLAET